MKKEDLIALGLSEEDAKKVAEASNEELKSYIPKVKFDEVNITKKKLEDDLAERDGQLETLRKSTGNIEDLKNTIETLQSDNKTTKETYEAEIRQVKLDNAIENSLITSKARNTKAVKALLNMDNIKLEGDSLLGLDEQIKSLKEDENSNYMFEQEKESKNTLRGTKPAERRTGIEGQDPPLTLQEAIRAKIEGNQE